MAIVVFLVGGFLIYKSLVQIPPGHRGVLERRGQVDQILKPGSYFVLPFLDRVHVQKDRDDET